MREVSVHVQTWREAGETAAQCWVAVPGDVPRLLRGQLLAGFRLDTSLLLSLLRSLFLSLVTDVDKVTNISQCERCQCMCRLGGKRARLQTQCWVALPGDVMRLLLGQLLAGCRLDTSLLLSLYLRLSTDVDKVTYISQCERCQYMCRLGGKRARLQHSAGWQYRAMYRDCCSVNSSPAVDLSRASFIASLPAS